MATYKLIQDIEAEDKVLGPLSLRQFVFAMVAAFFYYMCFFAIKSKLYPLLAIVLPPALLLTFFAFPFGKDQPTEVWAVAKFNYLFRPRTRIWNQTGVKNLVTITVPKKVQRVYTKGLSGTEVSSRLKALADTMDSRGWAVKNINLNTYAPPAMMPVSSDRLIDMSSIPQSVPDAGINSGDDMLDMHNNPLAQQLDSMLNRSNDMYKDRLMQQVAGKPAAPTNQNQTNNYWFMNNTTQQFAVKPSPQTAITSKADETVASKQLKEAKQTPVAFTNLRTLKKSEDAKNKTASKVAATEVPPVTAPADPAILSLADNNDLNVETLAREAKRVKGEDDSKGEVVVSLR